MKHHHFTGRRRDEALVRDTLKQAFDTPLTAADLADGETAVRSLAATMHTGRSVVDIGGRRRRVAAAVAAGVFLVSSGVAAAGGGDPLAGARRIIGVIAPAPASEPPEIAPRLVADEDDDRSDHPASRLAPDPSTTTSTEPDRSEPVPPIGSPPVIEQMDPEPGSPPSDTEAELEHPERDHDEPDDDPTADEDDHDTHDHEGAEAERHGDDDADDDVELDDGTPDVDTDDPVAADEADEADEDAEDIEEVENE